MGVSGSGKTTIGKMLAERLATGFIDADDLHPASNKRKMAAGVPLDDDDRAPWLATVGKAMADAAAEGAAPVVACSSLKRSYRDRLRAAAPTTFFVHLHGSFELLSERLAHRHHEFMPSTLLRSQFAALEPLEGDEQGATIQLTLTPALIVEQILSVLSARLAPEP